MVSKDYITPQCGIIKKIVYVLINLLNKKRIEFKTFI